MRYGIENHPSITSEYVKFLVTSSSYGGNSEVENTIQKLEDKVSELERTAKGAKTGAESAENSLELLKKKLDKLENKK